MAEFKAGTREQVKNGQAQYVAGDIVAKDAKNYIGGTKVSWELHLVVSLSDLNL